MRKKGRKARAKKTYCKEYFKKPKGQGRGACKLLSNGQKPKSKPKKRSKK